jgi:hypothetical protein
MARLEEKNIKGDSFMGITFDRHISIGHIFTTVSMIVIASIWYANTENRLFNLEKRDSEIAEIVKEYRADYRDDLREIKVALKDISDKLDKKADRGG